MSGAQLPSQRCLPAAARSRRVCHDQAMQLVLLAQQQSDSDGGIPWWAYIFYLWLTASVCIYLYRLYRRLTRGKSDGLQVLREESPASGLIPPPRPTRSAGQPEQQADVHSAAPRTGTADETAHTPEATGRGEATPLGPASTATSADLSGSASQLSPHPKAGEAIPGEPSTLPVADRTPHAPDTPDAPDAHAEQSSRRSGLFASRTPTSGGGTARAPVARLLQGISMPCDLAPVIGEDAPVRAGVGLHVAFSTAGTGPSEVGRSLGDELERLGFSLESVSDTQVEATRSDGTLLVSLLTKPAEVKREGRKAYPALPPRSIVVEFESI